MEIKNKKSKISKTLILHKPDDMKNLIAMPYGVWKVEDMKMEKFSVSSQV